MLNDKSLVSFVEDNWDEVSPQLLSYPRSRTDLTKRIKRFYLSGRDYEFDNETSATTPPPPSSHQHQPPQRTPAPTSSQSRNQSQLHSHGSSAPTTAATTAPPHTHSHHEEEEEEDLTINFEEQFKSFTNVFTDRHFMWPLFEAIRLQISSSRIYAYENMYEGQHTMLDVYTGKSKEPAPAMKKVKNWFKTNILGRKVQAPKHLGTLLKLFPISDITQ